MALILFSVVFWKIFACLCVSHMVYCTSPMFDQAYHRLSECDMDTNNGYGKKLLLFIKWKFLEAKVFNAINIKLSEFVLLAMFSKCCLSDSNYSMLYHQAAAYYYHGLILDKGNEPSCHVSAVCCFLTAEEILSECKKACLSFCLATPVTRLVLISTVMHRLLSMYSSYHLRKAKIHCRSLNFSPLLILVLEF